MLDATTTKGKTYCMNVTFRSRKTGEETDGSDEQWFSATDDADAKKQAQAYAKYCEYNAPIYSISVREHLTPTLQAAFEGEQVWADMLAYYEEFEAEEDDDDSLTTAEFGDRIRFVASR